MSLGFLLPWIGILLATAWSVVLGFVWYEPLFGKQWRHYAKGTKTDSAYPMWLSTIVMIITSFIASTILALTIGVFFVETFLGGMLIGALLWLGFIFTQELNGVFFENRHKALLAINGAYGLINLAIGGGIIALFY